MEHLTKLFKLLQITKVQPLTGFSIAGMSKDELSNLAEHQYGVTFIAWQLVKNLNRAGANIDQQKVMELALVHDFSEVLGGDLSFVYARVNPVARKKAKEFQKENEKYMAKFFGPDAKYYRQLIEAETSNKKSDEAIVVKVADYLEHMHYKFHRGKLPGGDVDLTLEYLAELVNKLKDKTAKTELQKFLKYWRKDLPKETTLDIILNSRKK